MLISTSGVMTARASKSSPTESHIVRGPLEIVSYVLKLASECHNGATTGTLLAVLSVPDNGAHQESKGD